jgi:hypothetical protein
MNITEKNTDLVEKSMILASLFCFIAKRPGLEYGNYCDMGIYRAEMRSITRDLKDAKTLLAKVGDSYMPASVLKEAFSAYSGRLSWDGVELDYTTGQYFPTEYRKAVCAVASHALWKYYGDDIPYDAENRGDKVRAIFRRMFKAPIAMRWFK